MQSWHIGLGTVWLGTSVLLGMVSLALLVSWARGDRSRGRKRCPKCWYDMTGVNGLVCPECGRDARTDKRLFRTRRQRWRLVIGLLLATISGLTWGASLRPQQGAMAFVPTTALVLLAHPVELTPTLSTAGTLVTPTRPLMDDALIQRADSWTRWQWINIVKRNPPIDRDKLAEVIVTRPVWPEGSTIHFKLDASPMMPTYGMRDVEIECDESYPICTSVTVSPGGAVWEPADLTIDPLPPGAYTVRMTVTLRTFEDFTDHRYEAVLAKRTVDVSLTVKGAATDVLPATGDARGLRPRLTPSPSFLNGSSTTDVERGDGGSGTARLVVLPTVSWPQVAYPAWRGPAVPRGQSLTRRLEIRHGDTVVASMDIENPWQDSDDWRIEDEAEAIKLRELFLGLIDRSRAPPNADGWSVRVTGSPKLAVEDLTATSYYGGKQEFDLPSCTIDIAGYPITPPPTSTPPQPDR